MEVTHDNKEKSYPKQFKIDAIKLVIEQGYKISEVAQNLAIHLNVLQHGKGIDE